MRCIFSCHVQGVQWKTCEGQNVVTSLIPWPLKLNKLKRKCFEIQYSSWLSKLKIIFTSLSCQKWGRKMKVWSSICNNQTIKTVLVAQYDDIDIHLCLFRIFISDVSCSLSACKHIQQTIYLYKACKIHWSFNISQDISHMKICRIL